MLMGIKYSSASLAEAVFFYHESNSLGINLSYAFLTLQLHEITHHTSQFYFSLDRL